MANDFLQNVRLRSIFEPPQQGFNMPAVDFNMGGRGLENPEDTPYDVQGRMAQLYSPETQATDRFNSLVGNMPQYERPSLLRTIAAGLSAFGPGGHETGERVMNWHNDRNMQDWKTQLAPAQQAASLERQNNANERTLAYQQVSQELRARADEQRALKNEREAAIRQQRANVYQWKAEHPNMKFIFTKGGNVFMVDPTNPARRFDTGIPTGTLSETDKMHLSQDFALERIEEQGSQTRETENVRHGNRMGEIDRRGIWGASRGRGSATSEKPETPSQRRTRLYNSAQELVNTNSTLGQFVTIEPGGRFKIEPPGEPGFFGGQNGPTKQQYDEIVKFIYGNQLDAAAGEMGRSGSQTQPLGSGNADTNSRVPSTSKMPPSPANVAPPPGELVTVINPQGKPVRIRKSQLQQALASGYRVQ